MKDKFDSKWILENSIEVCRKYDDGVLTIRGLHYQLVSRGMHNTMRHYKRVVSTMIKARREKIISFYQFSDHDREITSTTEWAPTDLNDSVETAKQQIVLWMESFSLNRWENQNVYPELWIEKKALIGAFKSVCKQNRVGLAACKGYPSLTFLNDAADRFSRAESEGKTPLIIYFGDYDPSGEDIPRSIKDNLWNDFNIDVMVDRIALTEPQVVSMGLPPAPAKVTDSRTANWDGLGQVELDAVSPEILREMAQDAIDRYFDNEKYNELMSKEKELGEQYVDQLREYIKTL